VDLDAARTFVAVVDAGQFQHAATDLSITQQAVSKRIAALETDLGVRCSPAPRAEPSSPWTGRRSCRTPTSCCAPRSGRPPRCVPAGERCGSTWSAATSRRRAYCGPSTARIPTPSWTW
jgi:Bacterial regulatory helix-turn-helix protein, lysR family